MTATGLPVTDWVFAWRESSQEPNEWAIKSVADNLITDTLSARRSDGSGRFRPSMIGNDCARAQVFSYLGFEQADSREEWKQMADAGSWLHYKWQYEGLAAGWLVETEIQVDIPEWELRGAVDGLCVDDSIFELKTVGTDKFMGRKHTVPVQKWETPSREHIRQVHAYMHATQTRAASIVYVDRDSNKFREFRVLWDPVIFEEMNAFVKSMQASVAERKLPPILSGCEQVMLEISNPGAFDKSINRSAAGRRFNFCNYREVCGQAKFPVGAS
jgi:hypothetical protein